MEFKFVLVLVLVCLSLIDCGLAEKDKDDDDKKNKTKKWEKFVKKSISCEDIIPAAEEICRIAVIRNITGFAFYDGCNECNCPSTTEQAVACTMMACSPPQNDDEEKYCKKVHRQIKKSIKKELKDPKYGHKALGKYKFKSYKFNCSSVINTKEICTEDTIDFKFFDGCNECTCSGKGEAECTTDSCSPPKREFAKKVAYKCKRILHQIKKDLNESKVHEIECFEHDTVCDKYPGATFYDGCNHCTCGDDAVMCTRMLCQFFGTEKQLKKHCKAVRKVYKSD